MYSYKQMTDKK